MKSKVRFGVDFVVILEYFLCKDINFCEQKRFKNCFKKRCPAKLKQGPIPMPPGPWSGALACALYKQETIVRAAVEALFEFFAEKGGLG